MKRKCKFINSKNGKRENYYLCVLHTHYAYMARSSYLQCWYFFFNEMAREHTSYFKYNFVCCNTHIFFFVMEIHFQYITHIWKIYVFHLPSSSLRAALNMISSCTPFDAQSKIIIKFEENLYEYDEQAQMLQFNNVHLY